MQATKHGFLAVVLRAAAKRRQTGKHILPLIAGCLENTQPALRLATNSTVYIDGMTSIGPPGSTWGEPGIIIVACGIPGGQAGGGQHLSPRVNQPPVRQVLQPENTATTSAVAASKNTFFVMISSWAVNRCAGKLCPGNSSSWRVRCKRNGGVLPTVARGHQTGIADCVGHAAANPLSRGDRQRANSHP